MQATDSPCRSDVTVSQDATRVYREDFPPSASFLHECVSHSLCVYVHVWVGMHTYIMCMCILEAGGSHF